MFSQKLAQTAKALAMVLTGSTSLATWVEMTIEDTPQEVMARTEFSMISFYDPLDEESMDVQRMIEEAKEYMEYLIAQGEWEERDLQWVKVDIEKYPELAFNADGPTQIVYTQGLSQEINYELGDTSVEEDINAFGYMVKELTGDWIHEIECDEIQHAQRYFYDELVYFGDLEDLDEGGVMDKLYDLSKIDRYSFDEQNVAIYINTDPQCREARDLEADKKFLVMFNGENSIPHAWEVPEGGFDLNRVMQLVTTSVVKGTPKWGQRAHAAIFDFFQNGIIYLLPEQLDKEKHQSDWKLQLMIRVTEITQEVDLSLVPIVSLFDQQYRYVPSIVEMMQVQQEDLPMFYVLHALSEQLVPYPEPLDDVATLSPELMFLWARRTILILDMQYYGSKIDETKENEADPAKRDELVEMFSGYVYEAKQEADVVKERLAELKELLAEKNDFADTIHEYADMVRAEVERLEQMHTDDL